MSFKNPYLIVWDVKGTGTRPREGSYFYTVFATSEKQAVKAARELWRHRKFMFHLQSYRLDEENPDLNKIWVDYYKRLDSKNLCKAFKELKIRDLDALVDHFTLKRLKPTPVFQF